MPRLNFWPPRLIFRPPRRIFRPARLIFWLPRLIFRPPALIFWSPRLIFWHLWLIFWSFDWDTVLPEFVCDLKSCPDYGFEPGVAQCRANPHRSERNGITLSGNIIRNSYWVTLRVTAPFSELIYIHTYIHIYIVHKTYVHTNILVESLIREGPNERKKISQLLELLLVEHSNWFLLKIDFRLILFSVFKIWKKYPFQWLSFDIGGIQKRQKFSKLSICPWPVANWNKLGFSMVLL